MTTARLRQKLENGFRSFAIQVSSGKRSEIPHPEFTMVGKNVVAALGNDDPLMTLDAPRIVAIEDLRRRNKKI